MSVVCSVEACTCLSLTQCKQEWVLRVDSSSLTATHSVSLMDVSRQSCLIPPCVSPPPPPPNLVCSSVHCTLPSPSQPPCLLSLLTYPSSSPTSALGLLALTAIFNSSSLSMQHHRVRFHSALTYDDYFRLNPGAETPKIK